MTRKFRHFLLGKKFICRTDHSSLRWLLSFRNCQGQVARWLEELSQYDMVIEHRPGDKHINADVLSRIPNYDKDCLNYKANVDLMQLPCCRGGTICNYCSKLHEKWKVFNEEVDDVIPLAVRVVTQDESIPEAVAENWLEKYSAAELRAAQLRDSDLRPVINWLELEMDPSQANLYLRSPAVRHYWLLKDQLFLSDGVLFYRWEDPISPTIKLMVPFDMREEILKLNHDIRDSGHMGQANTFERVKRSFYWYHMRDFCYRYVKSCSKCNLNKKSSKQKKAAMGIFHAGAPMDRVMIDILGPLTKTPRGNTVILNVIDQFTKWIECYPLPAQDAERCAKSL